MAIAPPVTASNADLVAWAFDRLNAHDVDSLRRFWSDATVERFPQRTCVGATEIAAYFEAVFAALPDFHMEILGLAEQHDDVFVRWRMTGTHTGEPFDGIASTGRRVEVDGIDHFVVRDGRVVSNFVVFDQLQFAQAVGLMPPDGSPADRTFKAAFNARAKVTAALRARRRSAA